MQGKGFTQTSSPFSPRTGLPWSLNTSTAMPRQRRWISPRQTGPIGLPPTKQEMMSVPPAIDDRQTRSEEHTSELQSLMRISYAVFCLKKKNNSILHIYINCSLHMVYY